MNQKKKSEMEINVVLAAKSIKALAKEMQQATSKEVTLSDESIQAFADAIGDNIIFGMEMLLKPIFENIKEIKESVENIESDVRMLGF